MNLRKLFIKISNKHDLYYRVVLITVSILVITAFLPQQVRFKYDDEINTTWHYDDLPAPFDFPVYKSKQQIQEEKAFVMQQAPLYFRRDTLAKEKALQELRGLLHESSPQVFDAGAKIIYEIYGRGLIELPRTVSQSDDQPLFILTGNEARPLVSVNNS